MSTSCGPVSISCGNPRIASLLAVLLLMLVTADAAAQSSSTMSWSRPAAGSTLSGSTTVALRGSSLRDVRIYQGDREVARANVSWWGMRAVATIDTRGFANGPLTLVARASSGTAVVQSQPRTFIVDNGTAPVVGVSVSPSAARIATGSTQQFTASVTGATGTGVSWSVLEPGGGTITVSGVYTAPASAGTYTVKATALADATRSASVSVQVVAATTPPVTVAVNPQALSLALGGTQTFTCVVTNSTNRACDWSIQPANGGSITDTGLYTAPLMAGTYTIVATSRADSSKTALARVTVSAASIPPSTMPGTTPAALGAPTTTKFNNLGIVLDTLHRVPSHAVPAVWDRFSASQNDSAMPSIPNITVLNRRDALIVYLPNIRGAADYRAYVVSAPGAGSVTFSGSQPRGAVIACAGYRQRFWSHIDKDQTGRGGPALNRELMQAIEIPGLTADGNYQVIVEALATPCPFVGVLGHTSALLEVDYPDSIQIQNNRVQVRSTADVTATYGNMILNGQGAVKSDYTSFGSKKQFFEAVNRPVPPNSALLPADPRVIARSAISVMRPAADEAANAPIFDLGVNAVFDDFAEPNELTTWSQTGARGCGPSVMDGWAFWVHSGREAVVGGSRQPCGRSALGSQVWKEHGRLYTTSGDRDSAVFSQLNFVSTKTQPLALDATKYAHSFFRVDSAATVRRYWTWSLCGADSRDRLVDPATRLPRVVPLAHVDFDEPGGDNLTAPNPGEASTASHNQECLNLLQKGAWSAEITPSASQRAASFYDVPHTELRAFIHPAGAPRGVINLTPIAGQRAIPWRLNAERKASGPMFEPFDQLAPLTHFDVFVRPDRIVFYVNGRQAWCADLRSRPLTMKYGLVGYGQALYHSSAEVTQNFALPNGASPADNGGSFHYVMNTPWTDTRAWDAVGHSEKIDIPPQFAFDPNACFAPASTAVR